jgi:hypothetical protein
MGWLETDYYKGKPLFEFFSERFNWEHGKLLDLAVVNRQVAYGAWQNTRPDGTTYVLGIVILIKWSPGRICYKDMSEDMGPCENSCPERILKQLSPLEDFLEPETNCYSWAKNWREQAWKQIEKAREWKRIEAGAIIYTGRYRFSDGSDRSTFLIEQRKPLRLREVYADSNGDPQLGIWVLLKENTIKKYFRVVGRVEGGRLTIF